MAAGIPAVREIVERVFARQDVLDACKRRDLSKPITVLGASGVTQVQIAALTGIPQGRLSEYKTRKRNPADLSTFEDFADGLGLPAAARRALGLAPEAAGAGPADQAAGRPADTAGTLGDVQPLLANLSRASAVPVLSALRGMHRGYVEADRLMGSLCITGPIQLQMPVVKRACAVTRGADRAGMLRFACPGVQGCADPEAQGCHLAPAILFERGPGRSHRLGQGLRGGHYRGCCGRTAGRGRPRTVLHADLRGDGSRSVLGPPRAPQDRDPGPGEQPRGVAGPRAGPRLRTVRVPPGDGLCRGRPAGPGVRGCR
jgi:hypothetical protein